MRVQAALKDVPTKPPSAAASSTRASAVQKKKSQPSLGGGVVGSQTPVSQRFDNESMSAAKRSARARKAPTKLGEGGVGSKSSAAVQQLPEPLRKCHAILCTLERAPGSQWFNVPVDPAALGVIHYPTIVPSPMDLGTVKRRLEDGDYADVHALAADVRLVFRNALTFNVLPEAQVHQAARDLLEKFEDALKGLWKQLAAPASASTPNGLSGGKRRDVHYDDEDDSFGAGGKRPRSSGKQSTGSKKSGKGKKGPRTPIGDDDVGTGGMVPIEHLTSMREQMESMQATILELQRQAAKTDIEVQMNRELAVAPQTAAQKAAQRRALLMKKELTYEEKTQLSTDINSLPPEKVGHVVKIVQDRMPLTSDDNDAEVEIDLEALDTETLRHLQNYVRNCLKRRGGGSGSRGSKKAKKGGQSPATTPVPTTPAPTTYDTPSSLLDSSPQALEALGGGLGAGFGSDDEDDDDIASSLA